MNKYEAENVHWTKPWIDKIYLQEIAELSRNNIIEKIVCHGCSFIYNEILELLFREKKYKVYWLFWGFELYRSAFILVSSRLSALTIEPDLLGSCLL